LALTVLYFYVYEVDGDGDDNDDDDDYDLDVYVSDAIISIFYQKWTRTGNLNLNSQAQFLT